MHFDDMNSPHFRTAILQLTTKSRLHSGDGGALIVNESQVIIEARNGRLVLANTRELLHGVLPGEDVETWAALRDRVAKMFDAPIQ